MIDFAPQDEQPQFPGGGPRVTVRNTFLDVEDDDIPGPPSDLRRVGTAPAAVDTWCSPSARETSVGEPVLPSRPAVADEEVSPLVTNGDFYRPADDVLRGAHLPEDLSMDDNHLEQDFYEPPDVMRRGVNFTQVIQLQGSLELKSITYRDSNALDDDDIIEETEWQQLRPLSTRQVVAGVELARSGGTFVEQRSSDSPTVKFEDGGARESFSQSAAALDFFPALRGKARIPQTVTHILADSGQSDSTWCYAPATYNPNYDTIEVLVEPRADGPQARHILTRGDFFKVSQEVKGADGILYLKLADERGWVLASKSGVGTLCDRLAAQVEWTVDARKLQSSDKNAVSPPFDLPFGPRRPRIQFKMMLYPSATNRKTSFKQAKGCGYVQLKCGEDLSEPTFLKYFVSIGEKHPRGPVAHDFKECAVSGLRKEEELWAFNNAVHKESDTFAVRLHIVGGDSTK